MPAHHQVREVAAVSLAGPVTADFALVLGGSSAEQNGQCAPKRNHTLAAVRVLFQEEMKPVRHSHCLNRKLLRLLRKELAGGQAWAYAIRLRNCYDCNHGTGARIE